MKKFLLPTKSSTKQSSLGSRKIQRTVSGRAFYPQVLPDNFYFSVKAWVEAKCPNNAVVYDSLFHLLVCNIPVVDARQVNGVYVRVKPRVAKPTMIDTKVLSPLAFEPSTKKKVVGIQSADTKAHNKMSYQ